MDQIDYNCHHEEKNVLISHMRTEGWEIEAMRKDTAHTFAKYYGELKVSDQAKQEKTAARNSRGTDRRRTKKHEHPEYRREHVAI